MSNQSAVISKQWAERPILFQTEMVKAILKGRKTQTRRLPKTLEDYCKKYNPVEFIRDEFREDHYAFFSISVDGVSQWENPNIKSPLGKPGDLIWVRESWNTYSEFVSKPDYSVMGISDFVYRADDNRIDKWNPSIHMPKDAARIWLMIEDIRVERVQEISEGDARAEGISHLFPIGHPAHEPETFTNYTWHGRGGDDSFSGYSNTETAKESFQSLWYSINGEESWNANPWVWVIQFRVLSTTGRPSDEVIELNYKEVRNG